MKRAVRKYSEYVKRTGSGARIKEKTQCHGGLNNMLDIGI